MSRRLDYRVEYAAPPEKIYQDLSARQYWEALMEAYRPYAPQSEVTHFSCGDSGGTRIVFTQTLPRAGLPQIARAVIPIDMAITREQHFDPYDHGRNQATGTYRATIPGGPGHLGGNYLLTETDRGSELRLASVCKVSIPFVGGRLEELIMRHITVLFDAEQRFTADWVSKHH